MTLQTYAIINTNTGNVENIIQYENQPTNPPPAFDSNYIAVQSDQAGPGWTYVDNTFIVPPQPPKDLS